jgi:Zn-dependent protease with chaperone function
LESRRDRYGKKMSRSNVTVYSPKTRDLSLWQPDLFLLSVGACVLVIGGGSWFKLNSLKQGGGAIAQRLGGRLLVPGMCFIPQEQQLLNVVEEMAIAAGVSMPQVYILDSENGINAFAAGYTTEDAAIGITNGCLEQLNRDELQGVIAHEFSHILNGDMRLNIKLIAALHGILMVYTTGRVFLSWRSNRRGVDAWAILALLLMAIGSIGYVWARIIQSAVSRQREYLADASATQFTRNPEGLASVLQKIAEGDYLRRLGSPYAVEMSHMFFADALRDSLFGDWFATHPPIKQRLRHLKAYISKSGATNRRHASSQAVSAMPIQSVIEPVILAAVDEAMVSPTTAPVVNRPGWFTRLPEAVQVAIETPSSAIALVYALLLAPDNSARQTQQIELLHQLESESTVEATIELAKAMVSVDRKWRSPLLDLALPTLRQIAAERCQNLQQCLQGLGQLAEESFLSELVVCSVLSHDLPFAEPIREEYATLDLIWNDCSLLFSLIAHLSHNNPNAIAYTFRSALDRLPGAREQQFPDPPPSYDFSSLSQSLERLSRASEKLKQAIADACFYMITLDRQVSDAEADLMWAIAFTLERPLPPFLSRYWLN